MQPIRYDVPHTPLHLEFALTYLIEASCISSRLVKRRLNGLESVIAELARPWRQPTPIFPAHELRMAEPTRRQWLEWVDVDGTVDPATKSRLALYASDAVMDESVPTGWVRLRLLAPRGFALCERCGTIIP